MTLIGLDLDNTLIIYDELFHKVAVEQGLIEENFPKNKKLIRDKLRAEGQEKSFTLLQGEVYGSRIREAQPAEGLIDTLRKLRGINKNMAIVSHKTKFPYEGPKYDLHESAMQWLIDQKITGDFDALIPKERIFFEPTIEKKIERIAILECTHFVDDLQSVLNKIPNNIIKVHYVPDRKPKSDNEDRKIMRNWKEGMELLLN